ncbi:MAG: cyclopropane-fatty-acyl-phospholipid synthase family protein [Hyphomicrobiales bacterium]
MIEDTLLKTNIIPDILIRKVIHHMMNNKLKQQERLIKKHGKDYKKSFFDSLCDHPIAIKTDEANDQHYELPTEFFQLILGSRLKYSSGYWKDESITLDQSEVDMMKLYIERSQITDGHKILDLGCGWGSLSIYLAETFPNCNITSVSNSSSQKEYIDNYCKKHHLTNVNVITCDVNKLQLDEQFDRIVSVEMFEHIRNYKKLFSNLHKVLNEDGKIFVHIFSHKNYAYLFKENSKSWMEKTFFSGGTMPSEDLLPYFAEQNSFTTKSHWTVSGLHYQKTLEAWLNKMDKQIGTITPILKATYGSEYKTWKTYWRVFFMACSECFGFNNGNEWRVSHYLFEKTSPQDI